MHDLEWCSVCPDEIAEEKPISIIDNDDFVSDTLTGGGTTHRCNWMFLRHVQYRRIGVQENEVNIQDEHVCVTDAKTVSQVLTEKASEMQEVTPYRIMKRGEHPICPEPVTLSSSTEPQRKQSVIQALTRGDIYGYCPGAGEETIPSYNGFHAGLNKKHGKSKAYFHMSSYQLCNKSVVNDIMDKLSTIMPLSACPLHS